MKRSWIILTLTIALAGGIWLVASCGGGGGGGGQTSLLVFAANDGDGRELWTYDGSGSPQMVDIDAVTSATPGPFGVYKDNLYFRGSDGTHGIELMVFDGVNTPTLAANMGTPDPAGSHPGEDSSENGDMVVYQDKFYFSSDYQSKLMVFDGVSTPSELSTSVVNPRYMIEYDGKLFFRAEDTSGDMELWSFDGTTPSIAASINPTGDSGVLYPTEFNGKLYFSATASGTNNELWCYEAGSAWMVTDITGDTVGSVPAELRVYDDRLYFSADDQTGTGKELWVHEAGTNTAHMVTDIYPGGSSWPDALTVFDNKLYFIANNGSGRTLWVHNGGNIASTVGGVGVVNSGSGMSMVVYKGKLYFSAEDVDHGIELWSYDGINPPSMVEDILPGTDSSAPVRFFVFSY